MLYVALRDSSSISEANIATDPYYRLCKLPALSFMDVEAWHAQCGMIKEVLMSSINKLCIYKNKNPF